MQATALGIEPVEWLLRVVDEITQRALTQCGSIGRPAVITSFPGARPQMHCGGYRGSGCCGHGSTLEHNKIATSYAMTAGDRFTCWSVRAPKARQSLDDGAALFERRLRRVCRQAGEEITGNHRRREAGSAPQPETAGVLIWINRGAEPASRRR